MPNSIFCDQTQEEIEDELRREELMDRLIEKQLEFVEENFGKDQPCNIGWVTDDSSVTSKVYNKGILHTYLDKDGEIQLEFNPN
jgi:hypothetical protein